MRPNLFLIAAPRAGSTQLARWLESHPDISLAPVKEPNFFAQHEFPEEYVAASHLDDVDPARFTRPGPKPRAQFAVFRDAAHYEALFADMTSRWRMEASTSYLACPEAPAGLRDYCPDARLIFLTRDPVDRALSHYRLALRTGRFQGPLSQALEAELRGETLLAARFLLRPSAQDDGIARFRAHFPNEQCLQVRFSDMIRSPEWALDQFAEWLDIDPQLFELGIDARNAGVAPRFPALNRLLQVSGLKTRLRRILPSTLKQRLKPIWFDENRQATISAEERSALAAALGARS